MSNIRNCEIIGFGTYLPEATVKFGNQTRYRIESETQLDMLTVASELAVKQAGIEVEELDCIISASAVGVQPIPCTAALLQERVAPEAPAAAFDINSTCTSFITAMDIASGLVHSGRYKNVLISSGDVGSLALNPNHKESYELFSDAAASVVLSSTTNDSKGVVASAQRTWPEYAHDTEIRGGLTAILPSRYEERPEDYMFDMDGRAVLRGFMNVLPPFLHEFQLESGLELDDFSLIIPHQASRAVGLAMRKLGIPKEKYVDIVRDYGNMVSASVPFAFCQKLEEGALQDGDLVMLCGTAAGLTVNFLALQM